VLSLVLSLVQALVQALVLRHTPAGEWSPTFAQLW